jgi:hypothetical protein
VKILFGLRQVPECDTRLARLQKHRIEIGIGIEQAYRGVTIPETQPLQFVRSFHMRHAELEHGAGTIAAHGRRDPRAAYFAAVKRLFK